MSLKFPNEAIIQRIFDSNKLLNTLYLQDQGVPEAIANLAKTRFAGQDLQDLFVKLAALYIIDDLKTGNARFPGEEVPNLGELGLTDTPWNHITRATEGILRDCLEEAHFSN